MPPFCQTRPAAPRRAVLDSPLAEELHHPRAEHQADGGEVGGRGQVPRGQRERHLQQGLPPALPGVRLRPEDGPGERPRHRPGAGGERPGEEEQQVRTERQRRLTGASPSVGTGEILKLKM